MSVVWQRYHIKLKGLLGPIQFAPTKISRYTVAIATNLAGTSWRKEGSGIPQLNQTTFIHTKAIFQCHPAQAI